MTFWEILNSPFIVTIVSFLLGGLFASAISAAWQKRSHSRELQLDLLKETTHCYQEYIRTLRSVDGSDNRSASFDRLHSFLLSRVVMMKIVFDENTALSLRALARRLANIKNLQESGNTERANEQLLIAYSEADSLTAGMTKMLL